MSTDPMPLTAVTAHPCVRPRLLDGTPILALRDGTLQIGCDADRGLRLRAAPDGTKRLLGELTGEHTVHDLARRCTMTPEAVDNVVDALGRHHLLVDDRPTAGPLDGTRVARVVADMPLGVDIALGLLAAGIAEVQVVDARGPASSFPQEVRHRRENPDDALARLQIVDHLDRRPLPPGTPTVVLSGRLEVDPADIAALMRCDDPHVVARPRPGGIILGPFVIPGRTSCLACADLARAARDDSWVEQRAALTTIRADFPSALSPWAVTTLLTQIACWTSGGMPDLADRTVEMGVPDWRQRWRAWRPHPQCGCRWGAQSSSAGASMPPSSSMMVGSATMRRIASP